jgi:hypothetical protein
MMRDQTIQFGYSLNNNEYSIHQRNYYLYDDDDTTSKINKFIIYR